LIKSSVS
jgi:Transcriptional regulator/sugar kinase